MSRRHLIEYRGKPTARNTPSDTKSKPTITITYPKVENAVTSETVITTEDVDKNISFLKKLNEILTQTLISDDVKLLTNIIDDSGKIILSGSDLCELISLMLSKENNSVAVNDIAINYKENFVTDCLKVKILPYKHISNIKIKNKDFKNFQNEAYNILTDVYKISLRTVYIP